MWPWRNRRLKLLLVSLAWLCSVGWLYWYITREKEDIRGAVPELLWWTNDMHWAYDEMRYCNLESCRVTNNRQRLKEARVSEGAAAAEVHVRLSFIAFVLACLLYRVYSSMAPI